VVRWRKGGANATAHARRGHRDASWRSSACTVARPRGLGVARGGGGGIVILIALVAALLAVQSGHRTAPSASGTPTVPTATTLSATATPSGPQWTLIDSYTRVPGIVLAPSDPRTAYQGLLNTSKTSLTTLTLQRTRDGGATWQPIALPARLQGISPDAYERPPGIMVSPLSATTVYLTAAARLPSCPNSIGQAGSTAQARTGGATLSPPLSSGPSCYTQYFSTDGGTTWHDLSLPVSNLLTGPYNGNVGSQPLRSQGARLYALISPPFVAQDTTPPAGRLARSEDGGITWTLADAGLPSTVGIADYMPAPASNAIFVVSDRADRFNSGVCGGCLPPPDYKLWRSDDAGAHWAQVGALPYQAVTSLFVARRAGGAAPVLYLQVLTGTGQDSVVILSSGDGGHTWSRTPTSGIDPSTPQSQGLWGVLADGSVIGIYAPPGDGKYTLHTFYAWKPGDAGWRSIAPQLHSPFLFGLIVGAPSGDGKQALTFLYQENDGNRVATFQTR